MSTPFVKTETVQGIAHLIIDRPQALNALNLDMVRALSQHLLAWAKDPNIRAVVLRASQPKALCAGGDIRFFYQAATTGNATIEDFFTEEYALNHLIAHYPKPYIALMEGVVMGGGMGISATARLRVVTDTSKLAMPETKIGLFPDVGGTHFLSHLPADSSGALGNYLALTGTVMRADSALYAGLADVYCASLDLPQFITELQSNGDINAVLQALRRQPLSADIAPGNSPLAQQRSWIEHHFTASNVAHIIETLNVSARLPDAPLSDWANATLKELATRSPLMLCATFEALRRARSMDLAQALRMERSLMKRAFAQGEPVEGIRALAVDKDHLPKWSHPHLAAVSAADLAVLFEAVWSDGTHPLKALKG